MIGHLQSTVIVPLAYREIKAVNQTIKLEAGESGVILNLKLANRKLTLRMRSSTPLSPSEKCDESHELKYKNRRAGLRKIIKAYSYHEIHTIYLKIVDSPRMSRDLRFNRELPEKQTRRVPEFPSQSHEPDVHLIR
jgi:hypothetical protein